MNNPDARPIRQQARRIRGQKRILHVAKMAQDANLKTVFSRRPRFCWRNCRLINHRNLASHCFGQSFPPGFLQTAVFTFDGEASLSWYITTREARALSRRAIADRPALEEVERWWRTHNRAIDASAPATAAAGSSERGA